MLVEIIIIIVCVVGIIFIIVRRLPQIHILNIDTIKEEQEAKVRDRILRERLNRGSVRLRRYLKNLFFPIVKKIRQIISQTYRRLIELEKQYQAGAVEKRKRGAKRDIYLRELLENAEQCVKNERFAEAEKIFIDVLGCDMHNIAAYRGLAELYFLKKELDHAAQTYQCLLKLETKQEKKNPERIVADYLALAMILRAQEKLNEAIATAQRALKLSPNNPKVIDLLLETSIISENKSLALEMCKKMEEVNPENQKLGEYRRRIEDI